MRRSVARRRRSCQAPCFARLESPGRPWERNSRGRERSERRRFGTVCYPGRRIAERGRLREELSHRARLRGKAGNLVVHRVGGGSAYAKIDGLRWRAVQDGAGTAAMVAAVSV